MLHRYSKLTESIETQSFTILGILIILIVDIFVYGHIRKLKRIHPQIGMYFQRPFVSLLLGLVFGYLMYRNKNQEVKESLRSSFEFLFMNIFLAFIILESALLVVRKVDFSQRETLLVLL
jgi:glucan phosphoethanolaminetransferase (alkaline phosphatase superfamily)